MHRISILVVLIAISARLGSPVTADLCYLILTGYALMGRRQVILALTLSWLFTMANPGLAPESENATIGRYAVLLAGVLSIGLRGGFAQVDYLIRFTFGLGGYFVLHSLLFSTLPDVSILKAVNWTLAMGTLMAAWSGLDGWQRNDLQQWLGWFLLLIATVSLPLIFFSEVGYLRNGTGFQGVLNHPQAFGPTMALLCALAIGVLLQQRRPNWTLLVITIGCLGLVVASEARTAGFALIFAISISLLAAPFLRQAPMKHIAPALYSKRFFLVGLVTLAIFTVSGQQLTEVLNDYIGKSGRAQVSGIADAYDISRGMLIEVMQENIQYQPWAGLGFGIASIPEAMIITRDPIFDLPAGAAIEKGVMPLAVLEEVGIPGFLLVVAWIGMLLKRAASNGMPALIVASTALLMNMGEATLFSPGGMGLLSLIFLSLAASGPPRSSGVGVLRSKTNSRA